MIEASGLVLDCGAIPGAIKISSPLRVSMNGIIKIMLNHISFFFPPARQCGGDAGDIPQKVLELVL